MLTTAARHSRYVVAILFLTGGCLLLARYTDSILFALGTSSVTGATALGRQVGYLAMLLCLMLTTGIQWHWVRSADVRTWPVGALLLFYTALGMSFVQIASVSSGLAHVGIPFSSVFARFLDGILTIFVYTLPVAAIVLTGIWLLRRKML